MNGVVKRRGRPTLAEAAQAYTVERMFCDFWKSHEFDLKKPNTKRSYKANERMIIAVAPELYKSKAAYVTRADMHLLYDKLRTQKGLPSAYGAITVMRLAFKTAIDRERGGILKNPCVELGVVTPQPRLRCASKEEITTLVSAADKIAPPIGDAILVALFTGQRQADVLALRFDNIRNGRILLAQAKLGARISTLVLPPLQKRLDEIKERNDAAGRSAKAVVCRADTGEHWNDNTFRHVYVTVRAEAQKELPSLADFRFLDLRDTAVTWLARAGCTVPEIASVTGHTLETITGTLKHYLVLDDTMNNLAMAKFGEFTKGFSV